MRQKGSKFLLHYSYLQFAPQKALDLSLQKPPAMESGINFMCILWSPFYTLLRHRILAKQVCKTVTNCFLFLRLSCWWLLSALVNYQIQCVCFLIFLWLKIISSYVTNFYNCPLIPSLVAGESSPYFMECSFCLFIYFECCFSLRS